MSAHQKTDGDFYLQCDGCKPLVVKSPEAAPTLTETIERNEMHGWRSGRFQSRDYCRACAEACDALTATDPMIDLTLPEGIARVAND